MNDVKKTAPKKSARTGSAAAKNTKKDVKKKDARAPESKDAAPKNNTALSKTAKATPKRPKKLAVIPPGERHVMIAEAAYYRAEQRGFTGDPQTDWLEAEAEIDKLLK